MSVADVLNLSTVKKNCIWSTASKRKLKDITKLHCVDILNCDWLTSCLHFNPT